MRAILTWLAGILAMCTLLGCAPSGLVDEKCTTVDGMQICPPFLDRYEAWGGQDVLGAPVSSVIMAKGRRIQYFETVCMEADPFTGQVKLTNLGDQLGLRTKPLDERTAALRQESGAGYYPETGHSLCAAFEGYYEEMGGVALFGYPIAEFAVEDDLIVQPFERAKLVWNPQDGLGEVHLAKLGESQWRLMEAAKNQPPGTPVILSDKAEPGYTPEPTDVPLPIEIDLSLAADVLTCPGQQTVMLRVQDASGTGLPGFASTVVVHERNSDRMLHLDATDEYGFASQSYDVAPGSRGYRVVIRAQVVYHEQPYAAVGSYVVW